MYLLGRQAFLEGTIAWLTDNMKVALVTNGYTPNTTTDQFQSIIGGGNIVATSANLASKTSTLGTANAANVTWSSVSGSTATYIVLYKDTGSGATSPLIMLIDTATNLPVTPNGGDISVQWDSGANKIFTLFAGLSEADRGLVTRLRDWLRGLGIPAQQSPGGLWIPEPKIVQV
jgi:hypothetical protein